MSAIAIPSKRISSIDFLRGIVMVIMALDHTRDYFSDYQGNPTDLQQVSTVLFLTRWITHFCAPVFVFLSGTSAFLSMGKGRTMREEAWRLLTRGLWLIVLEVTIVRLGWAFDFDYKLVFLQVIWAIGVSMVALSALIFLPKAVILAIGMVMIFGHNAFDNLHPTGSAGVLWQFLHVQSPVPWGKGNTIMVLYPLIPWVGVMATGFCFGAIFQMEEQKRNRTLRAIGISVIALFMILRFVNVYGDPSPWVAQTHWWRTVLSFVNCTKYPPSLHYLLMTLGPAIIVLSINPLRPNSLRPLKGELSLGANSAIANIFTVYGRVPLFYYILHIYLIHAMAIIMSYFLKGGATVGVFAHPGYSLPVVYAVWLLAVAILYLPCRWFMQIKMTHRKWWLSYL